MGFQLSPESCLKLARCSSAMVSRTSDSKVIPHLVKVIIIIIIPHQVRVREHDGNEDFLPLGVGVGQIQEVCPIKILPDVQGLEEDVDLGNHPLQFVRWRHYDPSLTWEYSWKYLSSVDLPAPTLPSTCNEPIRGQYYQD